MLLCISICYSPRNCRSQWPRGLRRRSVAAHLLRWWVRIQPGAWMFVCCVLSGRGLCDELITRPEESYRLWCVVVCDLEISIKRGPWPTGGCPAKKNPRNCLQACPVKNTASHRTKRQVMAQMKRLPP